MNKNLKKNLKRIKRDLAGGPLIRFADFLFEKRMKSLALNPQIPYGVKKFLANSLSQHKIEEHKRIEEYEKGKGNLQIHSLIHSLSNLDSIPVHLHSRDWNGIKYKIWEEKDRLGEDSDFTVFFPNLRFPNFSKDVSLTPEEGKDGSYNTNRNSLDGVVEWDIWKNILYQSPVFRSKSKNDRPGLSGTRSFKPIPYNGIPETVRVPFFKTKSLSDANIGARAIVKVFQEHQKPIENLIKLLKTEPKVRKEFIDNEGKLETGQSLKKYGFDIDILPYISSPINGEHEGVSYRIYKAQGGSFGGENALWYWGFINGIQLPNFELKPNLSEYEREISQGALKLVFDYALYDDPLFKPEKRGTPHLTPRLVNGNKYDEEAIIVGLNMPEGIVIPYSISTGLNYVRKEITTAIHAYNTHKNQIDKIVEKLEKKEIQKELKSILRGLSVSNLSDSVAEFLGNQGSDFILENSYHLERQKSINE